MTGENSENLQKFKEHVIEACGNQAFLHHDWYVKYHLNIVEKIALELCDKYAEADRDMVLALVWIHDYAKILDKENEYSETLYEKGKEKMIELGYDPVFVGKIIEYLMIFEKKWEIDLHTAPIEVRIVSSSDAAAHLVGPFWAIYYKENPDKAVEELMESNRVKLKKDWERKIVLPEVKKAFLERHKFVSEQAGDFPEKYFS